MFIRFLKAVIFSLTLFLPGLTAGAQKNFVAGYIVTQNADSLSGEIDFRDWSLNPAHITFRRGAAEKGSEWSVADLKAFGVNGQRYESFFVHVFPFSRNPESLESTEQIERPYDTTVFLEVIARGKLTLWEYRTGGGMNYYFVNGTDDKPEQLRVITTIHTEEGISQVEQEELFKNQLGFRLRDCPAAASLIVSARYNVGSLEKLFFFYNNCGKDTLEEKKGGLGVRVYPLIGYFSSKVRFAGTAPAASQSYPAHSSLTCGAGALFILPRQRQQFSFVTDVLWQHFQSASNTISVNNFTTESGHLGYSLLKVEILFRYRYPTEGWRPFVEGGMANSATFGLNCYQTSVDDLHHSTDNEPLFNGGLRHYQQGLILGAGVGAKRWTVEGRFEASSGISNVEGTASPTRTWYILLSYAF